MGLILGIDYGTKRIGTSISDETETIAQAFEIVEVKNEKDATEKLSRIIKKYGVRLFIIGAPLGLESKPTQMSEKIQKFADELTNSTTIEHESWNETLTSEAAKA